VEHRVCGECFHPRYIIYEDLGALRYLHRIFTVLRRKHCIIRYRHRGTWAGAAPNSADLHRGFPCKSYGPNNRYHSERAANKLAKKWGGNLRKLERKQVKRRKKEEKGPAYNLGEARISTGIYYYICTIYAYPHDSDLLGSLGLTYHYAA
jgi:hypothetical protein